MKFKTLDHWEGKESFGRTLPLCPRYYHVNDPDSLHIGLHEIFSKDLPLTINPESMTGFDEIKLVDIEKLFSPDYSYLTLDEIKEVQAEDKAIASVLINIIKEYFINCWDSERFHLVQCSGGQDSRLLAFILMDLYNEYGPEWLGGIHFVCHHNEGEPFKKFMSKMGWDKSQYSVHREQQEQNAEYYDYGNFDRNMNAFTAVGYKFWQEILSPEQEKEAVLINGLYGGELLNHPLTMGDINTRESRWNRFKAYIWPYITTRAKQYINWYNILMPYAAYEFVSLVFRMPLKQFKPVERLGGKTDTIRGLMLEHYKDEVPFVIGHKYDFGMSEERQKYILDMWKCSKFYIDFKDNNYVAMARPGSDKGDMSKRNTIENKLYSLATAYEYK